MKSLSQYMYIFRNIFEISSSYLLILIGFEWIWLYKLIAQHFHCRAVIKRKIQIGFFAAAAATGFESWTIIIRKCWIGEKISYWWNYYPIIARSFHQIYIIDCIANNTNHKNKERSPEEMSLTLVQGLGKCMQAKLLLGTFGLLYIQVLMHLQKIWHRRSQSVTDGIRVSNRPLDV